jgi:hypothetical protein
VFRFDVQQPDLSRMRAPGAQHAALWITGRDLFPRRDLLLAAIAARIETDPYATLDVVLAPEAQFPVDLIDAIRGRLEAAPASYASRALAHRGENFQRRLCVVLDGEADRDWIEAVRRGARVFRNQSWKRALADAERLGADLPCARVTDVPPRDAFRELLRLCDPDALCFADRALEGAWQRAMLDDIGP